jgi:tRNA/rRNA methyltransferase
MSSSQAERQTAILARNKDQLGVLQENWPLRWVMMRTSHPGNVGSAARALKTMGFADLHLVNPAYPRMQNKAEAIALASGALDVLENSQTHTETLSAVGDAQWVFGLTARDREFGPPAISLPQACDLAAKALIAKQSVAMMFGTERTGLDNEDLQVCTHRVWIDANPLYPSLNLAQAMMVVAYSLRQAMMQHLLTDTSPEMPEMASATAVAKMLEHWEEGLIAINYLDPDNPKKLMPRLQALFARAGLRQEEIDLLRGIAKQMLLHGKIR